MNRRRKFKYDYAGELHRRGLSADTYKPLIKDAILALMQRGEYQWRSRDIPVAEIDYETIDANRRAIVAEIDRRLLLSPETPPRLLPR